MAYNIMIIDDSYATRVAIRKVIQMSGFEVGEFFEAGNGQEALLLLEKKQPDVILTDINMPVMDGVAFFKELLKRPKICATPVIFVTTEGRFDGIAGLKGIGAVGYITKPFKPEGIKKILIDVLGVPDGSAEHTDFEGSDF
ncbi:MAG: response regulator [Pseudomonadota bacterium]